MIKSIYIGSSLLLAMLLLLFFISDKAVSESTTATTPSVAKQISVEAGHPLAIAHKQLEQARDHYKKGEIDKVNENLKVASEFLEKFKANNEVVALATEIKQLQQKINSPSDNHESTISRLWHRSSALVKREIHKVAKSWEDTSIANDTMKQLIDARLYFSYAEHDIFINHNTSKATEEINNTLTYLDKAYKIATPRVKKEIASIKKEIQQLPTKHINTQEDKAIIEALDAASTTISKSNHSQNPEIRARSNNIVKEIISLKNDVFLLEKRQQYDSIMKKLIQLDVLL